MNAILSAVDVLLHLGVPPGRLMTEVNTRLQQGFHGYFWHALLLFIGWATAAFFSNREPLWGHLRLDPATCVMDKTDLLPLSGLD